MSSVLAAPEQSWLVKQQCTNALQGCLVQVGNGIELEAVGFQFEPYLWRPCGVTWESSRTVVVIKLRRTSALPIPYCYMENWTSTRVTTIPAPYQDKNLDIAAYSSVPYASKLVVLKKENDTAELFIWTLESHHKSCQAQSRQQSSRAYSQMK